MLKKLPEIEIKPDAPFKNDALNRQESVVLLTNLVQSTRQPFVLSVEAPWGFGKSTFIKLWRAHLESPEHKHICLYFNAWENDFVDDPLVAFLGEMRRYVEENCKQIEGNEALRKSWEDVKRIGGGVLRKTLPLAIQIATHGLLSQDAVKNAAKAVADSAGEISEFASTLAKERLEKYTAEKEGIADFRSSLEKLADEITKGTDKKQPLVFFVDELDRCRPDFAVALLERIKHLFNVKNVVFVLAIDRNQLNQSVKALYGTEMKPDGYLRRFIDLAYQLPEPTADMFAWNLFSRFSFGEFSWRGQMIEAFIRSFSEFARVFGLSLRAQEQCFTEMNIALRANSTVCQFPIVLSFLATLRAFKPEIIQELKTEQTEIESVLEWISDVKIEQCRFQAEAALRVEFSEGRKGSKQLQELRQMTAHGRIIPPGQEETTRKAHGILKAMRKLEDWPPNATAAILSHLALSARFR